MKLCVFGMIFVGGQGLCLVLLMQKWFKFVVLFGSKYCIIDFVINNFINLGMFLVYVLIQYKVQSFIEYIQCGWCFGIFLSDYFIMFVLVQMYCFEEFGDVWYWGIVDVVYQNMYFIDNFEVDYVVIFFGDYIYKMNVEYMLEKYIEMWVDVIIVVYLMLQLQVYQFGVMQVDECWCVIEFYEKVFDLFIIFG